MTRDAPGLDELSLIDMVDAVTRNLLETLADLTDAEVAEPSLCAGWTRGHVLTHLARNADGLVNLLLWAHTGIETPQYASNFLRDTDIDLGAPRPAAEQIEDLRTASDRWLGLARAMPADRWSVPVRNRAGTELSAALIPWLRLRELQIHHVDLSRGYEPVHWPAEFVARLLPEVADSMHRTLTRDDGSRAAPTGFTVQATDTGYTATVGTVPGTTVSGPAARLAAWLTGRCDGTGLAGDPPALPAWL